jgi:hypothetical protein
MKDEGKGGECNSGHARSGWMSEGIEGTKGKLNTWSEWMVNVEPSFLG